MDKNELLEEAYSLFPSSEKPLHFTDPEHCEECKDHDETLLARTREDVTYDVLGNPGWDPICFVHEQGFKYYFPALVRLALEGTGDKYYIDQFLFHVTQNSSCVSFSDEQSVFVEKVLEYLLENKSEDLENNLDADALLAAIEHWGLSVARGRA